MNFIRKPIDVGDSSCGVSNVANRTSRLSRRAPSTFALANSLRYSPSSSSSSSQSSTCVNDQAHVRYTEGSHLCLYRQNSWNFNNDRHPSTHHCTHVYRRATAVVSFVIFFFFQYIAALPRRRRHHHHHQEPAVCCVRVHD